MCGKLIVFDEEKICERGTSIAVFDYATALRNIQGIRPVIIFDSDKSQDRGALSRFADAFEVRSYRGACEREALVGKLGADLYYYLKLQPGDDRSFAEVPVASHIVFDLPPNASGCNAYISDWLSAFMTGGTVPVVPHIVTLPQSSGSLFRKERGIPESAVVIGRHGGYDSFDIDFVRSTITDVLHRRSDLYFIFVNTKPFTDHPRAFFEPVIYNRQVTSDFIMACDAMIHGRQRGESFGLAMAEFLFHSRPVFCWGGGQDRNHLALQPSPDHVYWSRHGLKRLLLAATPLDRSAAKRDVMLQFGEEAVSRKFMDIFVNRRDQTAEQRLTRGDFVRRRVLNRVSALRDRLCRAA